MTFTDLYSKLGQYPWCKDLLRRCIFKFPVFLPPTEEGLLDSCLANISRQKICIKSAPQVKYSETHHRPAYNYSHNAKEIQSWRRTTGS